MYDGFADEYDDPEQRRGDQEEQCEQDHRDAPGDRRNVDEAERAGDQRNDEKNDRVSEHEIHSGGARSISITSAADLKFLQQSRRGSVWKFKTKNGTTNIKLLVAPFFRSSRHKGPQC